MSPDSFSQLPLDFGPEQYASSNEAKYQASLDALVENMSNTPLPAAPSFWTPAFERTSPFQQAAEVSQQPESSWPLIAASSPGFESKYVNNLEHPQALGSSFQPWQPASDLMATSTSTFPSSFWMPESAQVPSLSPVSTMLSLSPRSAGSSLWSEPSTGALASQIPVAAPQNFDGSALGLYESIMACNTHLPSWDLSLPGQGGQPASTESEETYVAPATSSLPRRMRSSFSFHRRAIQKSKSTSLLKVGTQRRDASPPSPLHVSSMAITSTGTASAPLTPSRRSAPLRQRASFLDVDPAVSGLKSPTKVLAYQARVRQQRSAMRTMVDDLRQCIRSTLAQHHAPDSPGFLGALTNLLLASSDSATSTPARSRTSSRSSERPSFSFTTMPTIDSQGQCESSSLQMLQGLRECHLLAGSSTSHILEAFSQNNCNMALQSPEDYLNNKWKASMDTEVFDDKSRSRQKNAYKQRLRSEELNGIDFLSSLAKVALSFVQTARADRSPAEEEALAEVKKTVWKHRAEWDLLLAAERRLGWGKPQKAKGSNTSLSSQTDSEDADSETFGVLVPFFFLSYPSASS